VICAVIGLIVNAVVVPPVLVRPAQDAVQRVADAVAGTLRDVATALREPQDAASLDALLAEARSLRALRDAAITALDRADDSLALNPRGRRHRRLLAKDREFLPVLTVLVNTIPGLVRGLHDRYEPSLADDPVVRSIALELDRVAHDLLLLMPSIRTADRAMPSEDPHPITAELPALTAPLVVAKPDPQNWIIVGALLEDLRRMRLEIVGGTD
jgi:hypothetical protein